ncbi:MAG: hypothetical protein V7L26_14990 [Nostoc sp.]|uniref:hypothetical protein n=1 Tax=Nostoc sp. TaxID=1180 RepID=UPI002FF24D49
MNYNNREVIAFARTKCDRPQSEIAFGISTCYSRFIAIALADQIVTAKEEINWSQRQSKRR